MQLAVACRGVVFGIAIASSLLRPSRTKKVSAPGISKTSAQPWQLGLIKVMKVWGVNHHFVYE